MSKALKNGSPIFTVAFTGEPTGHSRRRESAYPNRTGASARSGSRPWKDKVVQKAFVWVLQCIYEQDFVGFQSLDALTVAIKGNKVNRVLDADVEGFFDAIAHEWLVKFLEHRIVDPRILRLVRKWLTAGVSEDGEWSESTVGTPQGAVISPLLGNVFLHDVFDLWIQWWREK